MNIYNQPEFWCGELGYRDPGYSDFAVNSLKVAHILDKKPSSVLDVGCAMGFIVRRLRKAGIDAWGLDISSYALSKAPEDVKPYLVLGSADNLPFDDKRFDLVFSSGVLEHIPDDKLRKAIKEMTRVANRGLIGVACLDDPTTVVGQNPTDKFPRALSEWQAMLPPGFEVRSDAAEEWLRPPGAMPRWKAMRILLISANYYPLSGDMRYAGVERICRDFARELNRRGFDVTLAAPSGSSVPLGVKYIDTGPPGGFVEARAYQYYSHLLPGFDVIHDFGHEGLAMRNNPRLPAIKNIYHDPMIMKPPEPEYNIVAMSHWQAQRFRQVYGYEARVLNWNAADPEIYKPSEKSNGRFGCLGKIGPTKGTKKVIQFCQELGVPLDVIGAPGPGDPQEYIDATIKACAGNIIYWGEVSDEAKAKFLSEARALLYWPDFGPGKGEAHCHKGVESMCCGTPCILRDNGAMNEVVDDGVTGFLAANEDEFKEKMLKVDEIDRKACRERAIERFSIQRIVDRFVQLYQQVANGERWGKAPARQVSVPTAIKHLRYTTPPQPRQVRLDTTTACNARCVTCLPLKDKRKPGAMTWDFVERIIADISRFPQPLTEIVPVNYGELFLYPRWYDLLRLIQWKLPKTQIALATNGSLIDNETLDKLMTIGTLKVINFSVNAYYKETYEAFTGLKWETVEHIRKIIPKIHALRPDMAVWVSMVWSTLNQTELEKDLFVQAWRDIAVPQINPTSYCGHPTIKPLTPVKTPCRSIFSDIVVGYDGKISSCCYDANFHLDLSEYSGDLLKDWRNPKLEKLRELHNEGRRDEIELCKTCTFT